MFGAILGDIIGSRFEFTNRPIKRDFKFIKKESHFTDDSVMTLAIAEALMNSRKDADEKEIKKNVISYMQEFGNKYPYAGYGGRFIRWLSSKDPKPYQSWGNGSAMRVSSVGWLYDDIDRVMEVAKWTAEVTHDHPEGIKGAICTAVVIFLARTGRSKNFIYHFVKEHFDYNIEQSFEQLKQSNLHIESCMDSLPKALVSFFKGNCYEEVIRNAVCLGGDTDTVAAIAGSMAEAYYGIPDKFYDVFKEKITDEIMLHPLRFFYRIKIEDPIYLLNHDEVRNAWIANYAQKLHVSDGEEFKIIYNKILQALADRCIDNEEIIVPCIDVNNTINNMNLEEAIEKKQFQLDEELRLRIEPVKDDEGALFIPFFTSYEEINKGIMPNTRVNWLVKNMIYDAYYRDDIAGMIINPFSDKIMIPKVFLKNIIDEVEANQKTTANVS